MKKYLFFGDSFTFGEDAEDAKGTWPYQYLEMTGRDVESYHIYAMSGQSNFGIYLDLVQAVSRGEVDEHSEVYIGLTNIYRDATTLTEGPGGYRFMDNGYVSVNSHVTHMNDNVLSRYAESFCMEEDWILAHNNLRSVYAIKSILDRIGCKYYILDIILSCYLMDRVSNIDNSMYDFIIPSKHPDRFDMLTYTAFILETPQTASGHFTSTGYKVMAEVVRDSIEHYFNEKDS